MEKDAGELGKDFVLSKAGCSPTEDVCHKFVRMF